MIRLTKHQVIQMHEELLSYTGGTKGVRDEGLLESALAAPFMMFSGTELLPSLEEKAARLCYGLVKNHARSMATKGLVRIVCLCSWR